MILGESRQTYWLEIIEKELEKLESGDKKLMRQTGHAIQKQLESLTLRQMIELYERFRTFTSLEWSIDWSSLSLNSILRAFCGKDQGEERKYVLMKAERFPI